MAIKLHFHEQCQQQLSDCDGAHDHCLLFLVLDEGLEGAEQEYRGGGAGSEEGGPSQERHRGQYRGREVESQRVAEETSELQ